MRKKIIGLKIIILTSCLFQTLVISANAAGFVFNWQPFVADINLVLNNPDKEALIKNIYVADLSTAISEDFRNIFPSSAAQDGLPDQQSKKKFLPDNIKFTFYQISEFIPDRFEKYTNSDDEQLSKMINATTSLIYGDSKTKSLETIGKIIEPQINFYFEF
jgi:hypothetical protein